MRVWVDLTNSPHVLVMRPLIERMRAAGHEVEVTARDFAQTLQLLERYRMDHTAIGHHRGGKLADKGARASSQRSLALARWAPQAQVRRRDGPRLERRDRRRQAAAASRARPRSTTSGPRCSTRSTAAWRARWSCPR